MPLTNGSMPMKPMSRMSLGLRDQMLAAAEPDLQPHLVDAAEQRAQIGRRGVLQIERQPRQQRVEQRRLLRPQRMALAPAEEGAGAIVSGVAISHGCHRPRKRAIQCISKDWMPRFRGA